MNQLRTRQELLAQKIGASIPGLAVEYRVVLSCSNAALAVLMKLLVDKGLVTDAELLAAYNAATVDLVNPEPYAPQSPSP
jgi:hypothetical protein